MLIGPAMSPPITRGGGVGGAAGNRTRVQSAYYVRVYLHIPEKPDKKNIGAITRQEKVQSSISGPCDLQGGVRNFIREA